MIRPPRSVLVASLLLGSWLPAGALGQPGAPPAAPTAFPELAGKAGAAREAGRTREAIPLYRQAVALDPSWAEGLWYLGTLLYEENDFGGARDVLRRLCALTPGAGPAWAMQGLAEFRLQDYPGALTHLEKGRDLGLGDHEALIQVTRYHIAILLTRFRAFPNAIDILVGLARSQPLSDDLALALGLNLLRRPELPGEVEAASRALVIQAGGAAYLQAVGRHEEARQAFERLRAERGGQPGVGRAYRDFLAAYPKALAEPALRGQALAGLRRELEAAPAAFEANLYLGLLLREADSEAAGAALERAHAARPDAPEPAYELARLRAASGLNPEARELLEAAVARDPEYAAAHVQLAAIYYREGRKADGDAARARARLLEAAAVPDSKVAEAAPLPAGFEALAREATAARDAERLGPAVAAYEKALALRPSWDEGLWYLGTILYDQDRAPEAKETFLKLVNLKPEAGAAWAYLGLSEFRLKEYDAALQHLERGRALGLGGNESLTGSVRYYVAILLSRRGEFEMALQILSSFATAGNRSPSVIEALGVATLRMPRLPSEVAEGKKAVVAAVGGAAFDNAARRFAEAAQAYEGLLRQYPTEPNLHYAYGVFLLGQDPDRALTAFQEEIRLSPDHVFARLHLAFEHLRRNDDAAALPLAREAARLDPSSFAARNALGRALLEGGDAEGAIGELETGAKLAPDSPEMQFALARAYQQAGRRDDAQRAREEFRRLDALRKAAQQANTTEAAVRRPVPDPPQ